MKRLFALLTVCILLSGVLFLPARAESAASRVDITCTVYADGDCLVNMNVRLRLEAAQSQLTFPLPLNAKNISLNGSSVLTSKSASATLVDISRISQGITGEVSMVFEYTLPEAVKVTKINDEPKLQLDIPMLCGFKLPVESFGYVINMPNANFTEKPKFTSIYRQGSVESDMTVPVINGNQIIGSSKVGLNDHDGVSMSMLVPEEMFPTVSTYIREGNPELTPMLVFAGIALLYWLLFLRTWPLVRQRTTTAPEGITAGELGCRLTLSGGDLTMMVFSWAQLGYILIHMEDNGRVLLHKRMDMGNERNQYENKVFRMLFGNRRVVDATGQQYARLCMKISATVPNERNMYKGVSGNVKLFRWIACVSHIFCGICVAMNMAGAMWLKTVMAVILSILGAVSAWLIQGIAYRNHLRGKVPVLMGFVCIVIWLVLGILCGQIWIPLGCCVGEFIIGYLAAYGGRRSDLGRHDAGQVLGLRHYLKKLPKNDINRLLMNDPDYFFNMAPYALALGIINPYAKTFGRRMFGQCPYLVSRIQGKRTAEDWGHLMADAADMMDYRYRQLMVEQVLVLPDFSAILQAFRPASSRQRQPKSAPGKAQKKNAPKNSRSKAAPKKQSPRKK